MTFVIEVFVATHLDRLLSPSDAPADLIERMFDEMYGANASSRRVVPGFVEEIHDYRKRFPAGASKRPSRRARRAEDLVGILARCIESERREGWQSIAARSPEELVAILGQISKEEVSLAIGPLLALPEDGELVTDPRVHESLSSLIPELILHDELGAPLLLAHAASLVAGGSLASAKQILERSMPAWYKSSLCDYLRSVCRSKSDQTGSMNFTELDDADVFLAACYYEGPAEKELAALTEWSIGSVCEGLGQNEQRPLRDFKVRGLQPRIAELAFRQVYEQSHGSQAGQGLHDLNMECLREAARPWSTRSHVQLPPADWEHDDGSRYDVKSNLFFRSKQEKDGLRGFLVKTDGVAKHGNTYPGFVFFDSSDWGCSWVYIGEFDPRTGFGVGGERVLPFYFHLHQNEQGVERYADSQLATNLLPGLNSSLFLGYQLATGTSLKGPNSQPSVVEELLQEVVDRCIDITAETFIEYGLWKAITDTTLEALQTKEPPVVVEFLSRFLEFVDSDAMPFQLPRVMEDTLMGLWVSDVLRPLARNWHRVHCPACGGRATEKPSLKLIPGQLTSEGTILGRMECGHCGRVSTGVTILTHCHKCYHYPLIIGKNHTCGCGGLRCNHVEHGRECTACRKTCNTPASTDEEDVAFVDAIGEDLPF